MNRRFKIFYDDGTTAIDTTQKHGVICVVQEDAEVGRAIIDSFDWYYRKDGIWFGADTHGVLDQMVHFSEAIDAILQGRMVSRDTYQQIISNALADPDFPRKSAKRPGCKQGR